VKVDDGFARLALAAPETGGALMLVRSATNQKDAMESTSADARSDRANAGIYSGYIARNAETRAKGSGLPARLDGSRSSRIGNGSWEFHS
jgi:hypothetical protein